MCRASGPKPIAVIGKRRVPPLLQNLKYRLLDESIQHGRHPELSHPAPVRLVDLDSPDRSRLVGPTQQLLPNGWPMSPQVVRQLLDGHPVHSRTSFIGLDSFQCLLTVRLLAHLLHQSFGTGRAFIHALHHGRFSPSTGRPWGFTPTFCRKGQSQLLGLGFLPLAAHESRRLLPAPITLLAQDRSGLHRSRGYYALC